MSQVITAYRVTSWPDRPARPLYDLEPWSAVDGYTTSDDRTIQLRVPDGWTIAAVSAPGAAQSRLMDAAQRCYSVAEALALGLATVVEPGSEETPPC